MKFPATLLFSLVAILHADPAVTTIRLDPASPGREFTGIGAVSAGASPRLLIDIQADIPSGSLTSYAISQTL